MGQSNNPITLHKYLYANANPVMYGFVAQIANTMILLYLFLLKF